MTCDDDGIAGKNKRRNPLGGLRSSGVAPAQIGTQWSCHSDVREFAWWGDDGLITG